MIEVITAFATVVLAIVAILALGVSIWMAWQNRKLIRMYREPSVIVYLKLDDYNPGLRYICVKNVGNGPAHDISFHLSDKSLSMPIDDKKKLGDIDFVKKGMKLLAAGQDHTHFFQSTYDGFKIEPFEVRVEYYDSNNNRYGYKDKPFELDPSQFDKVWLDNHPLVAIGKELKAIREKGFGVFDNNIAKVLKDTSTTLKKYLEYKAIGQHVRQLPKGDYYTLQHKTVPAPAKDAGKSYWCIRRLKVDSAGQGYLTGPYSRGPHGYCHSEDGQTREEFLTVLRDRPDYKDIPYIPWEDIDWLRTSE